MLNITDVYNRLKEEVKDEKGLIKFSLGSISIEIHGKDSMGNLIQEWLGHWFQKTNISYEVLENTQEFPDYLLQLDGENTTYLEIKSWNYNNSPAFDLANFDSYINSLSNNPKKIDADYLIFGYEINEQGFKIKDIFLKKIWELEGPAKNYPVRIQVKKGVVYNLRPINFKSDNTESFATRLEFFNHLIDTRIMFKNQGKKAQTEEEIRSWGEEIKDFYKKQTGNNM
ncbi:NgoBV family restriction endonuclease [Holzapfeliella sp. He02]|uniref:NgoBV family restriction endonuclease n=1 Tax=Holzapfeliella saturejae TaxID=3082953 RepID=A0ABU8SHC1_9LACO